MPRILITSFGSFGDVYPYVGLALGLRARGCEPVIATSAFYREHVEREGIPFVPIRPNVDPDDRALIARIMDRNRGTEFLIRQLVLPALRDAYEDLSSAAEDVDLIVGHPLTFSVPVIAEERGIPWVSTVLAPMSFFSVHELPVFPPVPWTKRLERVPGVARSLVGLTRFATKSWLEPVRRLRAERGLPPGDNPLLEGQHSPHLVLALFSRVLGEPQRDWPQNVWVTGAILYNGAAQTELSPELERFLQRGSPPVVFTLGSSAVSVAGSFYAESAAAAKRAGKRAVLLVGRHPDHRPATGLSDEIIAVEHAPHSALMPRAAVTVHQGGAGTLHQALQAGRPMLVVPHAHDQPDNAHRAARLGVARVISPRKYRADRVAEELRALVTEPNYADRARAVAAEMRRENGVARACEAILRVLSD
jgi:UDP:flavonoid glycosyltransferase YjiC (YdhE family)